MKCLLHIAGLVSVALISQSCTTITNMADENLPTMVIVDENDVIIDQPPPHGAIGMSTAYRISDVAPKRNMEFRKRSLHVGAQIGEHVISHDEVYYVVSGNGVVISDGEEAKLSTGMAAYLYTGANVGIRQVGEEPLTLIVSYPLAARKN